MDHAKKSSTVLLKTGSRKAAQKLATGDLIENKQADKLTNISFSTETVQKQFKVKHKIQ